MYFFSFASSQAFGTSCFNLLVCQHNICIHICYYKINKTCHFQNFYHGKSFFFFFWGFYLSIFILLCTWVVWQEFYWAVAIHMTTHSIVSPWQTKVWIPSKFTLMNCWVLLELLPEIQIKFSSQDQKWFKSNCIIKAHPSTSDSSWKEANWSKLYIQ